MSQEGSESELEERAEGKGQVGTESTRARKVRRDEPMEGFPTPEPWDSRCEYVSGTQSPPARPQSPLWGARDPAGGSVGPGLCINTALSVCLSPDRGCVPEAADAIGVGQEGLRLPSVHPPSLSLPSLGNK